MITTGHFNTFLQLRSIDYCLYLLLGNMIPIFCADYEQFRLSFHHFSHTLNRLQHCPLPQRQSIENSHRDAIYFIAVWVLRVHLIESNLVFLYLQVLQVNLNVLVAEEPLFKQPSHHLEVPGRVISAYAVREVLRHLHDYPTDIATDSQTLLVQILTPLLHELNCLESI